MTEQNLPQFPARTWFGTANPERVENPLWEQAIAGNWTGYQLKLHLGVDLDSSHFRHNFSLSAYRNATPGPFWRTYEIVPFDVGEPAVRVNVYPGADVRDGSRLVFPITRDRDSDPELGVAFDLATQTWGEPFAHPHPRPADDGDAHGEPGAI